MFLGIDLGGFENNPFGLHVMVRILPTGQVRIISWSRIRNENCLGPQSEFYQRQ